MTLCLGTSSRLHTAIVHDEGWRHCPLCAALEEQATLDRQLEEARGRIVELESGASA